MMCSLFFSANIVETSLTIDGVVSTYVIEPQRIRVESLLVSPISEAEKSFLQGFIQSSNDLLPQNYPEILGRALHLHDEGNLTMTERLTKQQMLGLDILMIVYHAFKQNIDEDPNWCCENFINNRAMKSAHNVKTLDSS
ncbi:hypothetical protein CARUB_v10011196mg [Capsella rubella]|uniref:Uncharacterized protein n=1 Tax=Capsella rubella TaxID=81985 RepID=R0GSD8_9BRAS|nr:hypothetical protein CARUB_v10011196mg [Capsella rubella]